MEEPLCHKIGLFVTRGREHTNLRELGRSNVSVFMARGAESINLGVTNL